MMNQVSGSQGGCGCSGSTSRFCTHEFPTCGSVNTYSAAATYGESYTAALRRLQAIADAIPVRRYTSQIPTCNDCHGCGCNTCNGCHGCGCNSCNGCHGCGCNSCGCNDCHGGCGCVQDPCVQAQYYGYPTQQAAGGGALVFSRYSPPDDGDAVSSILLPPGRFIISYSANASATDGAEATLGLAPQINGVAFPRGGSFATVPAGGSATLSTSFVVTLSNQSNALGFYNTGTANTTYQLLNISITRAC